MKRKDAGSRTPQSARNDDHWVQARLTRRFQHFVEDWAHPDNYEAELYDLSNVTMPMSLFIGEKDGACSLEMAKWLSDEVNALQNYYVFKGAGHGWPISEDSVQYMDLIVNEVYSDTLLQEPNRMTFHKKKDFTGSESLLTGTTIAISVLKAILQRI